MDLYTIFTSTLMIILIAGIIWHYFGLDKWAEEYLKNEAAKKSENKET